MLLRRLMKRARGQIFGVRDVAGAIVDVVVDAIYVPLIQLAEGFRVGLGQYHQVSLVQLKILTPLNGDI